MAVIVREAIEEKLAKSRPRPRSIGVEASGTRDTTPTSGVRAWVEHERLPRAKTVAGEFASSADLVIEGRQQRSRLE
jgi:hypothetical protein